MEPEKPSAVQHIVNQIMGLGCRAEAVKALGLGTAAAVYIQTSDPIVLKVQLKRLFHAAPPFPVSLTIY